MRPLFALPPCHNEGSCAMTARRRFSQTESLQQRLAAFAKDARKKAATLPLGRERDDLLKRARQADTASHINDWQIRRACGGR